MSQDLLLLRHMFGSCGFSGMPEALTIATSLESLMPDQTREVCKLAFVGELIPDVSLAFLELLEQELLVSQRLNRGYCRDGPCQGPSSRSFHRQFNQAANVSTSDISILRVHDVHTQASQSIRGSLCLLLEDIPNAIPRYTECEPSAPISEGMDLFAALSDSEPFRYEAPQGIVGPEIPILTGIAVLPIHPIQLITLTNSEAIFLHKTWTSLN